MLVKGNQKQLFEALGKWFDDPPPLRGLDFRRATQHNKGHGRIETRTLTASVELNDYLNWPGLQQALTLDYTVVDTATGERTSNRRYAITSLAPDEASPEQLLDLWRRHWAIENNLHYPLDVLFQEDASQIRAGLAALAMALLRRLVINFIRTFRHYPSLKYAREHFAARPLQTLDLIECPIYDPLV